MTLVVVVVAAGVEGVERSRKLVLVWFLGWWCLHSAGLLVWCFAENDCGGVFYDSYIWCFGIKKGFGERQFM